MDVLRVEGAKLRRLWQILDGGLPGEGGTPGLLAEARGLVRDMLGVPDDAPRPGADLRSRADGQHAVGEDGCR